MKKIEATTKRKVRWTSLPCPLCGAKKSMREIRYGYLASPMDDTKFAIGGCDVGSNDPEIACSECNWRGSKEDLRILAATPATLTSKFLDAMNYANMQHAGQTRKAINIAYISYPFGVAALIIEARGDEDQAIGGLLHDVAADKTHNVRAIVTDLDCIGPELWNRFNASPADIVWYYESAYDILKTRKVTSVLLSPLSTSIGAMKRHL